METNITNDLLYKNISDIIKKTQNNVRKTVNSAMVLAYWNIGKVIVEEEQKGEQEEKQQRWR